MSRLLRSRWAWFVVLAGVAILVGAVAMRAARGPDITFDKNAWHSAMGPNIIWSNESDNRRARMLNDLLAHHLSLGMSRREVEKTVGEFDSGGDSHYGYMLVYNPRLDQKVLSAIRWRTMDPYLWLYFDGDAQGCKLVRVRVGR
jgi:hypothetical protein